MVLTFVFFNLKERELSCDLLASLDCLQVRFTWFDSQIYGDVAYLLIKFINYVHVMNSMTPQAFVPRAELSEAHQNPLTSFSLAYVGNRRTSTRNACPTEHLNF